MRSLSGEGIVHWASNPSINAERLRAARNDIAREYARRVPVFDMFKAEYLLQQNSLDRLEFGDLILPNQGNTASSQPVLIGKMFFLWCLGQPELARRTYRQILINNWIEISKPLHLRHLAT